MIGALALIAACSNQPAPRARATPEAAPPVAVADAAVADAAVAVRPFRIEYRARAALRCKGNRRVKIEDDGRVFAMVQPTDCPDRTQPFPTPYDAQPVRTLSAAEVDRLAAAVAGSGLLALPDENVDARKKDGHREELELQLGGQRRTIATQNLELPAFARVRELILRAAG
ncbi:MAG: hypothetical protein ABIY55_12950 [Kofleriaceae bacterium]